MTEDKPIHIIGAGPAGLTAARELSNLKVYKIFMYEQADKVGGISRTESYKGYLFDIGGHRFYSKHEHINSMWHETLGDDFRKVNRMSRIYYKGKYFDYPLKFWQTILNLGVLESFLVLASYLKAVMFPSPQEKTFEEWTINRFGKRLYNLFFKTYTEKVWGLSCRSIQADWAAQRIKGLSFSTALTNAFLGNSKSKTLINEFHYPTYGPGMMWDKFRESIEENNGSLLLSSRVTGLHHANGSIKSISYTSESGLENEIAVTGPVISSIPLKHLIALLDPPPPPQIIASAQQLCYRAFIIVVLIIDEDDLFPDQWIYIHSPEVSVSRIQNFKNWSDAMVPDKKMSSVGLEYFCSKNDNVWKMTDKELITLASNEIEKLGLAKKHDILDHHVVRQQKAYPVYDENYKHQITIIKDYLKELKNLQTIGRNGTHRYNNMDHSMLTGIKAAQNVRGALHDIWQINECAEYLENNSIEI